MRTLLIILLLAVNFAAQSCNSSVFQPKVKVGAEVLINQHLAELKGKRVGLVMNPTARIGGKHEVDILKSHDVNVMALFAPEHGFRGDAGAGETIKNGVDQATGLPVYSLYGENKKPTTSMLSKVDLLLFDMQGVGGRFYTYNATLGNVLEGAAKNKVPVWVLDRPNPAGGKRISGWMMHKSHQSFVGQYPIPMVHGMTLGELAKMMVGEKWIDHADDCKLKVIPMKGWKRSMNWEDTGLPWIPPSPNLPTFEHAYVYLGTVLFEGTTFSEGRGTPNPFLNIGSPYARVTSNQITSLRRKFKGVSVERRTFRPRAIPGKAPHPDYQNKRCYGVQVQVTDPHAFNPVKFGAALLKVMLHTSKKDSLTPYIEKLSGIDKSAVLHQLQNNTFIKHWKATAKEFAKKRKKYLIYGNR